ncbi:MAG: hypothetical protein H7Z72_23450 [Bacteroidetes bacterium]|nr:hypothetical protein [Fibrella sp.]
MKKALMLLPGLLMGLLATAQTKPVSPTPPSVVSAIGSVTGKRFLPDTAFAALSEEDETLLAKEPIANWGLPMESGKNVSYYNLIVGTRSYQVIIVKLPTAEFPTATLLRFTTPKSKPEPIARGVLKPKEEEKPK